MEYFSFTNMDFSAFTFLPYQVSPDDPTPTPEPDDDTVVPVADIVKNDMNDIESVMFYFNDNVYIIDEVNYIRFDGTGLYDVLEEAYVPTTSISRSPSGGGEIYEDVNLLTGKRKNSFLADGTSTVYYLDTTDINSIDKITVNGSTVTNYTVSLAQGKVTFTTAPSAPSVIGQDNVVIEFTKKVSGYKNRILKCKTVAVFDNRVFFSGNSDYKNAVFHCSLNNPAYVSDLDYYECGSQDNTVKSLVVGNNVLWVLKEENQNKDTIFYLTPTTDSDYGRIYPTSQGNVTIGCFSKGLNYQDSIVFFSRNGLEGINGNTEYEQSVAHKSSLVDSKLKSIGNYENLKIAEYKGYLVVNMEEYLFLADYRQQFTGINGKEYEWYLWKLPVKVKWIRNYLDRLYFIDEANQLYEFDGTNDNGAVIESYWTTPNDDFGYMNHLKTINKRGSIAKIKSLPNSKVKIAEATNKKTNYKLLKEIANGGFDFNNVDFSNFSFTTNSSSYVVFRIKEKKIIDISLKFYSDELDKPFGLSNLTLEAFLGGYVKRS